MSTHTIPVVAIDEVRSHPNGDFLDLARIGGYWSVVKRDEYKVGDLCVFVPPDYMVPLDLPVFAFLKERAREGADAIRIKAVRLRGERSFGLVVPAPEGAELGQEMIETWGITRYEPQEGGSTGDNCRGPQMHPPRYDLEPIQANMGLFTPETDVIVTGKIHGQNGRFVFDEDQLWAGSRGTWKYHPEHVFDDGHKASATNWWVCAKQNPWIEEWCRANPGAVLYGEVYGPGVQGPKFHYGKKPGQFGFVVFDVLENGQWVDNATLRDDPRFEGLVQTEVLYRGKFDFAKIEDLAEQKETLNGCGHTREGVVVKAEKEDPSARQRIALKYVSVKYLEKS